MHSAFARSRLHHGKKIMSILIGVFLSGRLAISLCTAPLNAAARVVASGRRCDLQPRAAKDDGAGSAPWNGTIPLDSKLLGPRRRMDLAAASLSPSTRPTATVPSRAGNGWRAAQKGRHLVPARPPTGVLNGEEAASMLLPAMATATVRLSCAPCGVDF